MSTECGWMHRENSLCQKLGTQLVFSDTYPRTLVRLDVNDDRLRFGSLVVIGKRVHEIIGIFKISRKQTLWSAIDDQHETIGLGTHGNTAEQSRQLLARGTIWIPGLGLGLTLRDGLVGTVHLCHPSQSPRTGTGCMDEGAAEVIRSPRNPCRVAFACRFDWPAARSGSRKTALNLMLHLALVASVAILVWWAMRLQRRWDTAIETPAVVVALDPPPPNPLPNAITLSFNDASGVEHRQTLDYMQFEMAPKMGDEINVRYLRANLIMSLVQSLFAMSDSAELFHMELR